MLAALSVDLGIRSERILVRAVGRLLLLRCSSNKLSHPGRARQGFSHVWLRMSAGVRSPGGSPASQDRECSIDCRGAVLMLVRSRTDVPCLQILEAGLPVLLR